MIRGLDTGVQHMSLGEHSLIKIRYDHAYASFAMVISSSTSCTYVCMHTLMSISYQTYREHISLLGRILCLALNC